MVEVSDELPVDECLEDLRHQPVHLVHVDALQDPDHLLPPLVILAVEGDLLDGGPRQPDAGLCLLQDLLDLLFVGSFLKVRNFLVVTGKLLVSCLYHYLCNLLCVLDVGALGLQLLVDLLHVLLHTVDLVHAGLVGPVCGYKTQSD